MSIRKKLMLISTKLKISGLTAWKVAVHAVVEWVAEAVGVAAAAVAEAGVAEVLPGGAVGPVCPS